MLWFEFLASEVFVLPAALKIAEYILFLTRLIIHLQLFQPSLEQGNAEPQGHFILMAQCCVNRKSLLLKSAF